MALYNFLRKRNGEGGNDLFSLVTDSRTCGKGAKLSQGRFRLDIMKVFFTMGAVKHWNRLPSELVDAPFQFKRHMDNAFSNMH